MKNHSFAMKAILQKKRYEKATDQTIEGKKVFRNIEVPKATKDAHAVNKKYVDNEFWGLD